MSSILKIDKKVMSNNWRNIALVLTLFILWLSFIRIDDVGYERGYEEGYQKALSDDSLMLGKFLENLEKCQQINRAPCSMRFLPMIKEKETAI